MKKDDILQGLGEFAIMSLIATVFLVILLFSLTANANEWAIKTIAYEASGEPLKGQIAVAEVIKNRIRDNRWPTTAYDVVFQPHQFSCWDPVTKQPTQKRKLTKEEIEKATIAWKQAQYGEFNHYANYKVKPYWIKSAIKQKRIGKHIFYKL